MARVSAIGGLRRRRNPRETNEAILEAAKHLMAERGPEALTVSDVAHAAGVNRTTAYQHFRSRGELVAAVLAAVGDEASQVMAENRGRPDQIERMVEYLADRPEIARLWMFQLLGDIPSPQSRGWKHYLGGLEALASSDGSRDGIDAEMLATLLLTATLGWSLVLRRESDSEQDRREQVVRFAREMKRLLLFGVLIPEKWPTMVAEVEGGGTDDPGGEQR